MSARLQQSLCLYKRSPEGSSSAGVHVICLRVHMCCVFACVCMFACVCASMSDVNIIVVCEWEQLGVWASQTTVHWLFLPRPEARKHADSCVWIYVLCIKCELIFLLCERMRVWFRGNNVSVLLFVPPATCRPCKRAPDNFCWRKVKHTGRGCFETDVTLPPLRHPAPFDLTHIYCLWQRCRLGSDEIQRRHRFSSRTTARASGCLTTFFLFQHVLKDENKIERLVHLNGRTNVKDYFQQLFYLLWIMIFLHTL